MDVVEILITGKNLSRTAFREAQADGATLGKVLAGVGVAGAAALAGIGVEAVKMASKFDSEMALLQTQAGVSGEKLDGLKKGVLDLASQVGFSPTSLAQSLFHVESNFESMGISSAKALELTKIAAEGAATGKANLVDVTNALTAAVASGIPGAKDYAQTMGILNGIIGVGDMHMQDLAKAFGSGMVATVKGFGLSIQDVGAALAVFGDNNIRGANAGTQLRMSVQALAKPIQGADGWLKKLGLTSDTLAADMRSGGLLKALEDLEARFRANGVSAKQQGQVITEIFGRKAGAGLNVLLDQMDRLRSKYPALQAAAGNFGKSWSATQSTLAQQWKDLQAGFDAMMIRLGEKLTPAVSNFLSYLHDRGLPIVRQFGKALGGIGSGFSGPKGSSAQQRGRSSNRFDYVDMRPPPPPDLTPWQKVGQFLRGVADDFGKFAGQVGTSLNNLWQAIQPTLKDLGVGLLGALKVVAAVLSNVLGPALVAITGFLASHKALVEGVVLGWLAFKGAVLGYTLVMKGAELATKLWAAAQAALDVVLDANPIALVVAAVALLVAGFYELYKHSEGVRIAVSNFIGLLKVGFGAVVVVALTVIKTLVGAWLSFAGTMVKLAAKAFGWIPGMGPQLRAAASHWDQFEASVTGKLDKMIAKTKDWTKAQANATVERELKIRINGWNDNLNAALAKLKTVPASKKAELLAEITQLQVKIAQAQQTINSLHGKTVEITTTISGPGRGHITTNAHGGVVSAAATGGARGALTWVGEQGPELVRLPYGSMVYPSGQSKGMAAAAAGGGSVVLELHSSGNRVDNLLVELLRHAIRVRGGNVQVVLGKG